MIWLALLCSPLALLNLYVVSIQYERGGWWRALYPVAVVGLVVDVLLAHSLLAVCLWDCPRRGEWTFSKQLGRLVTRTDWRGSLARYIARILDAIAPSGRHIHPIT